VLAQRFTSSVVVRQPAAETSNENGSKKGRLRRAKPARKLENIRFVPIEFFTISLVSGARVYILGAR
jgi:hypothetical protein